MHLPSYQPSGPEQAYSAYLLQSVFFIDPNAASFRISGRDAVHFLSRSAVDRLVLRNIWTVADPLNEGCLVDRAQVHVILRLVALAQSGPLVDALSIAYASGQTPIQGMIMCLEATKYQTFNLAVFEGITVPDMETLSTIYTQQQQHLHQQQQPMLDFGHSQMNPAIETVEAPTSLQQYPDQQVTPSPQTSQFHPQPLQLASIEDAFGGLVDVEDAPLPALPSLSTPENAVGQSDNFGSGSGDFGDHSFSGSNDILANENVASHETIMSGESVGSFNVSHNASSGVGIQQGQTSTIGSVATTVSRLSITEAFDMFDSVQQEQPITPMEPIVASEAEEEEDTEFDEFGDFEGHASGVENKSVENHSLSDWDASGALETSKTAASLESGLFVGTSTTACPPAENQVPEGSGWDALDALAEATETIVPSFETPNVQSAQGQANQAVESENCFGEFADSNPIGGEKSEQSLEMEHQQSKNDTSSSPCEEPTEREVASDVDDHIHGIGEGALDTAPRLDSQGSHGWDAFDALDIIADSPLHGFEHLQKNIVDNGVQDRTSDAVFGDFVGNSAEGAQHADSGSPSSTEFNLGNAQQSSNDLSQPIEMEKVDSTYYSTRILPSSVNTSDDLGDFQDAMDHYPTEHEAPLEGGVDGTENFPSLFVSGSLVSDDPFSAFDELSPPQSDVPTLTGVDGMTQFTFDTEITKEPVLDFVPGHHEKTDVLFDDMRSTLEPESVSLDVSQPLHSGQLAEKTESFGLTSTTSLELLVPPVNLRMENEGKMDSDDFNEFYEFESHQSQTGGGEAFLADSANQLKAQEESRKGVDESDHDDFGDFAGFEPNVSTPIELGDEEKGAAFESSGADERRVSTNSDDNFGDFGSFSALKGIDEFGNFESSRDAMLEQVSQPDAEIVQGTAEQQFVGGSSGLGTVHEVSDALLSRDRNHIASERVEFGDFGNFESSNQETSVALEVMPGPSDTQDPNEDDDFGDFASFEPPSVENMQSMVHDSKLSTKLEEVDRDSNAELIEFREKIVELSLQLPESIRRQQGQSKGLVDFAACFDANVGVEGPLTDELRHRLERCTKVLEHLGATGSKLGSTFWEQAVSITRDELSMGSFLLQEATSLSPEEAAEVRTQLTVYYHGLGEFVRVCRSILGSIGDLLLLDETALCTRDTWALSWCSIGLVKDIMEVEMLWKEVMDFSVVFGLQSKEDAGLRLEELSEIRKSAKEADLSCGLCQITLQPLKECNILTKSKVVSQGKEFMACAANMLGNKCSFF